MMRQQRVLQRKMVKNKRLTELVASIDFRMLGSWAVLQVSKKVGIDSNSTISKQRTTDEIIPQPYD